MEISSYAERLDTAQRNVKEISKLTDETPLLSVQEGYAIQKALIVRKLSRGELLVGYKMGLTSESKRKQMHVDVPIYGVLTDRMRLLDGNQLSMEERIHPKVEPEIAFIMGADLEGEVSLEKAAMAVSGVCAALDVIDSRYRNFIFTLPDVVADNCSSSAFVLGSISSFMGNDLSNLTVCLKVNGKEVTRGNTSAISGNPLMSIVQLSRMLAKENKKIEKGSIVLAGSATEALSLAPGMKVEAVIEGLGSVSLVV